MPQESLTVVQKRALDKKNNLSVGHAKYSPSPAQQEVRAGLLQLLESSENTPFTETEEAFIKAFFQLAGQREGVSNFPTPLFNYSTSLTLEVFANLFRLKNWKVGLITPTFDNLPDVLARHASRENVIPIPENHFLDLEKLPINIDVLFLTFPNNPTGFTLNEEQFRAVCMWCKENNILLAIDFCFRLTEQLHLWDQYKILEEIGTDFIAYEDTGKIWSIAEMKVGFMVGVPEYLEMVRLINEDMLLSVSPFILQLLTAYIEAEVPGELYVIKLASTNREYLQQSLLDTQFELMYPESHSTVAVIRHNINVPAPELVRLLEQKGVHVSPLTYFFWDNSEEGDKYIRVTLSRDIEAFQIMCDELVVCLKSISKEKANR